MALKDKILVAVDASDRCMETIRHITQRDPFQKKHLVLDHVFITLPDFYWDIEMEPKSRGAVAHVRAWEAAKKNKIEQHQRQEPVDHNTGRAGLIEDKPFFRQAGGQLPGFFSPKPAGGHKLLRRLGRLFAKGVNQVELFGIVPDNGLHDGDGRITDRKLHHPLFADYFGCFSEFVVFTHKNLLFSIKD